MKVNYPHLNTCKHQCHSMFSFVKDFDMFAVSVTDVFNFERHNYAKNKSKHSHTLGSYLGGVMTMVYLVLFVGYLSTLIAQMESGAID